MIQGTFKKLNGQQIVVYNFNDMELYTETENLVNPSFVYQLNEDLALASKVFWSSDEESWQGVMNERDIEEALSKMTVLIKYPTKSCESSSSTKVRARPGSNGVEPIVGMGASIGFGLDSDPYTVIEIKTPSHIVIQADEWHITSGNEGDGSARYEYAPNPSAQRQDVTFRRDGQWKLAGGSTYVSLGGRRRYRDPSF